MRILITGVAKVGASSIPEDELPIIKCALLIISKYILLSIFLSDIKSLDVYWSKNFIIFKAPGSQFG